MTRHLTRALALMALAAVAACSGGGSGATPVAASGGPATTSSTGHATLTFKRLASFATATASSSKRSVKEFSSSANSLVIDATQTGTTPTHQVFDISAAAIGNGISCTSDVSGEYALCSLQVLLALGTDTVTVATNSARDGSGSTLGSATMTVTILNAQDNPISITLDGKPTSMRLFVSDPSPVEGNSVSLPLTVQLYDASGTVLIAPQNYTSPVSITDNETTAATTLYTQATQNSTQRYNGTAPANTSPSPSAKTVTVPDRYTVPYLSYTGATIAAFTITATFGTLTASATVTPAASSTRPTGTPVKHELANTVRTYDPIVDNNGQLWVTQTGGRISSIDTSSYTVTGTYLVAAVGTRSLRSPVIGPDGAIYMMSATVSNGVGTAPYYVTRFDPAAHTFADYTPSDEPLHLTVANGSIVAAENTVNKVWTLPFSGTTPGTPFEFSVVVPPVADTTPVLQPHATRVFPSGDGNLYVTETAFNAVDGTWIAKYSPSGTPIGQSQLVDPQQPQLQLDAQAMDAGGTIWFVDITNPNEFVRDDTAVSLSTLTTYAVPRLYGEDSNSEATAYESLDASGNLYFVSYLTSDLGRIDKPTGRVDTIPTGVNASFYGTTIQNNTLFLAGFDSATGTGLGPFLITLSTS